MGAADDHTEGWQDPLAFPASAGEIRRLTILFADLVDSTALSTRVEPEIYRAVVGRYRDEVKRIVNSYEGHVGSIKGDGLHAVFGYPRAHEDDVARAVLAGLGIVREVARVSEMSERKWGIEIAVRVGIHRGQVYLDTAEDDIYGLAANLAARVSGLALPGTVVVSDAVESLVRGDFEVEALAPATVKGIREVIATYRVLGERLEPVKDTGRPLVGRERQSAGLREAWARAQESRLSTPGIAFVGEAGIGKSRLALLAEETVHAAGGRVVELTGSAFHAGAGLQPVRALLERRCGIGRLTDQAERLRLLRDELSTRGMDPGEVALLAPVLGIAPEAGYEPAEAEDAKLYAMIADAVRDYLLCCLGDGPALLVVEDLHWFDPSTMEVVGSLLGGANGRLLVVITARPSVSVPPDWPVEVVVLEPLTDHQSDLLATALNPALTAEERAAVRRRCDGVPFYIEQVVAGLDGSGVPEALYEPLFARLRASANVVPVVEAAGIIGRQVDRGLLGTVCELSDAEVDDVINQLEQALVLERWGADGWRFRHELLREVAVELPPPSVRRSLHARVADALVDAGGDPDWQVVAGHYERADRFAEAADAYQQASTAARRRGALAEARGYLTRALAQLDRAASGPERDRTELAVRVERGWLVAAADGALSAEAAADFQRSLDLTATDPRDPEMVETRLDLVESFVMRADLSGALALLESLRRDLGADQPWLELMVDIWFGMVAWLRGEFDSALSQLERAAAGSVVAVESGVEVYNLTGMVVSAHTQLAETYLVGGDVAGAEGALARAEGLTEGLGFPEGAFSHAYAWFAKIWLHVETGELDRAAALAAEAADLGERHGLEIIRLFGTVWQTGIDALAAVDAGPPDAVLARVETLAGLVDTLRSVELNEYVVIFGGLLGRLLIAAGQPEEARRRLDAELEQSAQTGMRCYDAELLRLRAGTHADLQSRLADLASALLLARSQRATLFELRAALDAAELRGSAGLATLGSVLDRFPAATQWRELARARALLS